MTEQMKQARDEKARTYGYNNAIYIDKAMLNKEGYQYLEEKPAKDFKEGTDWYRNNVWHSTIEDPEERKDILLMYKASDGRKIYHIGLFDSRTRKVLISQRTSFPWQQITNFEKWAYMEDLLPDKNI